MTMSVIMYMNISMTMYMSSSMNCGIGIKRMKSSGNVSMKTLRGVEKRSAEHMQALKERQWRRPLDLRSLIIRSMFHGITKANTRAAPSFSDNTRAPRFHSVTPTVGTEDPGRYGPLSRRGSQAPARERSQFDRCKSGCTHTCWADRSDRLKRFTYRSREQVAGFFAGTDLVAPGLVRVEEWRPGPGTSGAGKPHLWGGAGRKP